MNNLPDRLGESQTVDILRHSKGIAIAVAMSVGAVAYGYGFGVGGRSAPAAVGSVAAAATVDFCSAWLTAADSVPSSVLDSSSACSTPWGSYTTASRNKMKVVDATSLDFAATNALRVAYGDSAVFSGSNQQAQMIQILNASALLSVGECVFHRWEWRNEIPTTETINAHAIHLGQTVGASLGWFRAFFEGSVGSDSTYAMNLQPWATAGSMVSGRGVGKFGKPITNTLKTHTTYRGELRTCRETTDSARTNFRGYNSAGTLVESGADYECLNGSCTTSPRDTLGQFRFNLANWEATRDVELGNNGVEGSDPSVLSYIYFGSMAARVSADADDWIGAYPVSPESN